MKYLKYALLTTVIIVFSANSVLADCTTGGAGATSCSYKETTYLFFMIPITSESSISCGSGSYACCTNSGGFCIPNGKPEPKSINVMLADAEPENDNSFVKFIFAFLPLIRI